MLIKMVILPMPKNCSKQAQYDGYKNSEMEMSIRQNRSAEISAAINQQFYNIIRLSEQADQITEIGYQLLACAALDEHFVLHCVVGS